MKTTKEPKVKVGKYQTLVKLADGTRHLLEKDHPIGGSLIIHGCHCGKGVSDLYIAKEIVPRLQYRGLVTRAK